MSEKQYKILLLDNIDPVSAEILKERGLNGELCAKMEKAELYEKVKDADGIVVRSATKVNKELLDAAPNLKVVGRAGVGVDNIDIPEATQRGILVMNTPDGNTISTAEHACGLILSLVRNIPNAVASLKAGRWDRKKYLGTEVDGKTLGIVGLGKIGSGVAHRMNAFGMNIIGFDPYMTQERAEEIGVKLVEIDEVLAKSDIITVHTPLTDATRGLISKANAHKLKKGVRLVNCARGGIFTEEDLLAMIEDGTVAELALDVYSKEPPEAHLAPLLEHPNVVCTPHLGASTEEAQEKVAVQIAQQLADALEQKSYKGSLNGKSIALSTNREVQPYLQLAERLGRFAIQVAGWNVKGLSLEYAGDCGKHAEVLTDSFLAGYLHQIDEAPVNLINARFLAERKGIEVKEVKGSKSRGFANLITAHIDGVEAYKSISATPFGDQDYRIVGIDDLKIELQLEGNILLYKNIDKPGMLANVSGTLAQEGINIASLSLGRDPQTQQAITAVTMDKSADDSVFNTVSGMDGIKHLKRLHI